MSAIEIQLDAYVLPEGHRVFKLFPGETYRLNKEIVNTRTAFLDIQGLDSLPGEPANWTDAEIKSVITNDRLMRVATGKKPKKRPSAQDTKRLGFLKNLFFVAKRGDLILVPLGRGPIGCGVSPARVA